MVGGMTLVIPVFDDAPAAPAPSCCDDGIGGRVAPSLPVLAPVVRRLLLNAPPSRWRSDFFFVATSEELVDSVDVATVLSSEFLST